MYTSLKTLYNKQMMDKTARMIPVGFIHHFMRSSGLAFASFPGPRATSRL